MRKRMAIALVVVMLVAAPQAHTSRESHSLIRLHVLAHNNSPHEQAVKLAVRDVLLAEATRLLIDVRSSGDANRVIMANLALLETLAESSLESLGSPHNIQLMWGSFLFPTRMYGQAVLPAGVYSALNVHIGDGRGKNWWCIMYPPLCYIEGIISRREETSHQFAILNLLRGLWRRIRAS